MDVDCGAYWKTLDKSTATYRGSFSHSWHIGDPVFARDLLDTIGGDIDRHAIPTRTHDAGRLVLG